MNKILIINIFGIGDVLFTTPLIRNLKAYDPQIKIGYMCNRRTEAFLKTNPLLDQLHVYERDEFKAIQDRSIFQYIKAIKAFIQTIRVEGYDTAIDLSLHAFPGFFCWRAGIQRRIGLDYKKRGWFLSERIALTGYEGRHVVTYYFDLLKKLNIPIPHHNLEFPVPEQDQKWAKDFFKEHQLTGKKCVCLLPGGGASWGKDAQIKRWGAENYAKLADKLIENCLVQIILSGDCSENDLCQQIAVQMNHAAVISTQQNLHQFAALLKSSDLVVANDGGPLHVAVAVGARTVSIFGPVDERVYGPYPPENHTVVKNDIACRPCYRSFRRAACDHISCLTSISVDDVARKVELVL